MNGYKKLGLCFMLVCSSYQTIAALDPVGQSLSPQQLPTTVQIGDSLSATYTLKNNKQNPVSVTISHTQMGNGIITHDQCNGKTLTKRGAPGSQCTINIAIDPTTAGPLNWIGVMHYDFNDVPLTPLSTTVLAQTQQVLAHTDVELPSEATLDHTPPYPFTFRFTNTGTTPVTGNGTVTSNITTYVVETNDCLNKTLSQQNDFCLITGTFSPDAVGHVRIEGAFTYSSGQFTATTATETTVAAPTGRVIATNEPPLQNPTYVNQGPYSFTFKFTNNGADPATGSGVFNANGAPATVDNQCLNVTLTTGQSCKMIGTFSPTTVGPVILNGDFSYDAGAYTASTSTDSSVDATSGIVAQVITALPPNAGINTDYPVEFRFTNSSGAAVNVTQQLALPSSFTVTSNQCPNSASFAATSPNNVCTISGTFNSSGSSSIQTITATMNSILPPATATTQTLTQAPGNIFVALWPLSLRVSADAINMPYQFQYQINNNYNSPATAPITVSFIAPATATLWQQVPGQSTSNTYFQSYYQCQNNATPQPVAPTLFNPNHNLSLTIPTNPGGICTIYVAFTDTATKPPNPYTDNFTMAFETPTNFPSVITPISYATGQPITANGVPLTRTITFTNHCPYTVTYALHGASIQAKNTASVSCTTDADCFNGSSCYQGSNECQWIQPTPTNGYSLTRGVSTSVVIPLYDNAIKLNLDAARDVAWGGNLAGRAGCSGSSCLVNNCGPDPISGGIGKCSLGIGTASSPVSASEFTLQSDDPLVSSNQTVSNLATDNYNIQLIDGVTVPSTMTPTNGTTTSTNAFSCTGAGLTTPISNSPVTLGSCSWDFSSGFTTPPDVSDYLWVTYTNGATACPNGTCVSGSCGLMVNPAGTTITKACGAPVISSTYPMYWTADAVCKVDPTYGAPFFCSASNNAELYGCKDSLAVSCYGTGTTSCCGCTNWPTVTGVQNAEMCVPSTTSEPNPDWVNLVEDKVTWIKKGCPTSYAYPYDDASSSFTCLVNEVLTVPTDSYDGNVNTTNYAVEFCPQL